MTFKDVLLGIWKIVLAYFPLVFFIVLWTNDIDRRVFWTAIILYMFWVAYMMRDWFKQVWYLGQITGMVLIERYLKVKPETYMKKKKD